MKDFSKLKAFSHGFFQDILTLMEELDVKRITKEQVTEYRDHLIRPYKKKSGRRHRFGTPVPGARPIELKRKPCKGCKDEGR